MGFTNEFSLNPDGTFPQNNCECCAQRMTSFTVSTHKYTEDEIRDELIYLAQYLAECKWYNRGNTISQIKHWAEKLDRLENAKSEFDLK